MKTETEHVISKDIMIDALTKYLSGQDIYKHMVEGKYISEVDLYDYDKVGLSSFIIYLKKDTDQLELPFNEG